MQGLVTLDFGNSHPHAGLFHKTKDGWELKKVVSWSNIESALKEFQLTPDNSSVVLAEVKPRELELFSLLKQGFLLTRVKDYWKGNKFAGMPVAYAHTLGEDRLIEAFYCFKLEKKPLLLIDAGTFTTMDVVSHNGFLGGYIVPGLPAYFSLFAQGENLKAIALSESVSFQLPQDTSSAMSQGYGAFAALAKKLIEEHRLEKVVLTGGQALFWEKLFQELDLSVVVQVETTLIHLALKHWMTTQIEPL